MSLELRVINLGKIKFADLEKKQLELAELRAKNEIPDTLLIAEHPPTITTGNTDIWNKVHVTKGELKNMGIDYHESNRGGGAAALGPGQLIFYPIISLKPMNGIWNYMRAIEEIAHKVASDLGAKTILDKEYNSVIEKDYTCVWHLNLGKKEKFLAQGYLTRNNITTKGGFAVNLTKEAHRNYKLIDHCGFKLDEIPATSFEEMIGFLPPGNLIKSRILEEMSAKFGYEIKKERLIA